MVGVYPISGFGVEGLGSRFEGRELGLVGLGTETLSFLFGMVVHGREIRSGNRVPSTSNYFCSHCLPISAIDVHTHRIYTLYIYIYIYIYIYR